MSYGIGRNSPVAPDATDSVHTLNKFIPCVVRRWAVTQHLSVTNQLYNGIRYFDLRFCLKKPENKFYFVHGLFCEEVLQPLVELKIFLDEHPREFIILDCQHFYNFSHHDHIKLSKLITEIFDNRIYGRIDGNLISCTLNNMHSNKKQVLIIYRNNDSVSTKFWFSYHWPTPWPNQIEVDKLRDYLTESLENRPPGVGYVSQCVLTPTVQYIVPRFLSSLRSSCAKKVSKKLNSWIADQSPGLFHDGDRPKVNVFLADFIDIKSSDFCKLVVQLNSKILVEMAMREDEKKDDGREK